MIACHLSMVGAENHCGVFQAGVVCEGIHNETRPVVDQTGLPVVVGHHAPERVVGNFFSITA